MNRFLIVITFFSGFVFQPCFGEKFSILKADNYKEVGLAVEEIPQNALGITREGIITSTKLRLLSNNIKVTDVSTLRFIHVIISPIDISGRDKTVGTAIHIGISFARWSDDFDGHISSITQSKTGINLYTTSDYNKFMNQYNRFLDFFILDYLESNME
jgi:hypothetical protein